MKTHESSIRLDQLTAVIFDMDGVLIDSMPYHAKAWITVLKEIGVTITQDDVYSREGESGTVALSNFLSEYDVTVTPEVLQSLLTKKEILYKQIAQIQPFPGAPEFVAALRKLGKKLAIVTGTARHELLESLPSELREQFDVVVTGDQVTHGKPHPEPYLLAMQQLGIEAHQAVVIENAPLGLLSARAAGVRCIVVETSVQCHQLAGADHCFPTLRELAAFLLGTMGKG